jgi:hypothetical protein
MVPPTTKLLPSIVNILLLQEGVSRMPTSLTVPDEPFLSAMLPDIVRDVRRKIKISVD